MPSAGYSHFYAVAVAKFKGLDFWCQCPRRAILISTKEKGRFLKILRGGVNALGGLFSFLLTITLVFVWLSRRVSMPSAGYSHFYVRKKNSSFNRPDYVSMPSAGYSHFYILVLKPVSR